MSREVVNFLHDTWKGDLLGGPALCEVDHHIYKMKEKIEQKFVSLSIVCLISDLQLIYY